VYRKEDYIAVFDSGVGGISVLRQLRKLMPGENYIYYGDSANAPYGSRTTEEVRTLTLAAAKKLTTEYPVKALVIACNTATAAAVKQVREAYPDLIVIGIEPALKVGADHFPGGRIGVMATEVTLREEKFDTLLEPEVRILGEEGDWYHVWLDFKEGWMMKEFIREVPVEEAFSADR
jgi:glutamate racemase